VVTGTLSAAGLTLIVLPITYYWARRVRQHAMRRAAAPASPVG